jgi:predicted MFS family arabinose efflux permease
VSSVYLIGLQGGIVVGSFVGGVIAGAWGVTAPFWFGFVGSAVLVAFIWPQLPNIAHADEARLRAADEPGPDGHERGRAGRRRAGTSRAGPLSRRP